MTVKSCLKKLDQALCFLIFLGALFYCASVLAYSPPSAEELQRARQLRLDTLFKTLSSGGIQGNLGGLLLVSFSMLIPAMISFFFALVFRFYVLRVVQYPALICLAVAVLVFMTQPQLWTSGDWAKHYIDFAFILGSVMGGFSAFLLHRNRSKCALLCLISILLGGLIYLLRL